VDEVHKGENEQLREMVERLIQENTKLKQEVVRLRDVIYGKGDGNMSSKLRDALRE
jgi:regulator of replication initiation timing